MPSRNQDMKKEVIALFDRYQDQTNAALAGHPDMDAIGDLYEDAFIGASPGGVMAGRKDDEFTKAVAAGFAKYRQIGTRRMDVRNIQVELIDPLHALARVDWRATYDVKGAQKEIDFTNTYLTRVTNGRARVFGWITGDEDAELRKHGIIG